MHVSAQGDLESSSAEAATEPRVHGLFQGLFAMYDQTEFWRG